MSGERGPLSVPIDLDKRRGNPGHRKRKPGGGESGTGQNPPPRPSWLQGEARREWLRVTRELRAMRRLEKTDRAVLAEYCVTWARWVDVEAHLDTGYLGVGSMGQVSVSPIFQVWADLNRRLEALSKALGLHVNARVRLPAAPEQEDESELADLLGGRKRA